MIRKAATAALLLLAAAVAHAQAYPNRPIRLVNGFAAGGSSDIVARLIAQKISPLLGQEVVVEPRTGAGGVPANEFVNKSAPDGYTLLIITGGYPTQAAMLKSLPYDPISGFTFISTLTFYPFVFVVSPTAPQQNAEDFIRTARAAPGKLSFASAGIGSIHHLSVELFNSLAGADALHVPFRGGTGPINEIMAGRIDAMFETMTVALPQVKAGKLRALAVTGDIRHPDYPEIPTAKELGYPEYVNYTWTTLTVRSETPEAVTNRLVEAVQKVMALPVTKEFTRKIGSDPLNLATGDMRRFQTSEIERFRAVAHSAGIKPE